VDLGGMRGLLVSWRGARERSEAAVLAVVTGTSGSTYQKRGAMALLDARGIRFGALSGGCLEPELERRARLVLEAGHASAGSFDTNADGDRIFGSGLGCRGRLDTILLPIPPDSEAHLLAAMERAFAERATLRVCLSLVDGTGTASAGGTMRTWGPDGRAAEAATSRAPASLEIPPPPSLLLLGAGPETPVLLAFTRRLG
jgi:xanthine dehydrogenase accessory factor